MKLVNFCRTQCMNLILHCYYYYYYYYIQGEWLNKKLYQLKRLQNNSHVYRACLEEEKKKKKLFKDCSCARSCSAIKLGENKNKRMDGEKLLNSTTVTSNDDGFHRVM